MTRCGAARLSAGFGPTRRDVTRGLAGGVLGWIAIGRGFAQTQGAATAVADAPFASLLALGDRTWATVSKPREGSFDTLCNGGLVAGQDGVLAFDCYATVAGAAWLVERSRSLTGLPPTDVVLSHHHGDHTRGLAGFAVGSHRPQVWTTRAIRDRVAGAATGPAAEMLAAARLVEEKATVDLGGRGIVLTPLQGHTASDLVAQVDDQVLFCGDLVWNELFPNYVDALPDLLGRSVDTLLAAKVATLVPGTGRFPTVPRSIAIARSLRRSRPRDGRRSPRARAPRRRPRSSCCRRRSTPGPASPRLLRGGAARLAPQAERLTLDHADRERLRAALAF